MKIGVGHRHTWFHHTVIWIPKCSSVCPSTQKKNLQLEEEVRAARVTTKPSTNQIDRKEFNAVLEQVRTLQKQKSELLVKTARAQDKQWQLRLEKDNLQIAVDGLSTKHESLLSTVKALQSERDKLKVSARYCSYPISVVHVSNPIPLILFSISPQHECEIAAKTAEERDKLRGELADATAQVKSLEDERESLSIANANTKRTQSQSVEALNRLDTQVQVRLRYLFEYLNWFELMLFSFLFFYFILSVWISVIGVDCLASHSHRVLFLCARMWRRSWHKCELNGK